jgi:hypothetical protein
LVVMDLNAPVISPNVGAGLVPALLSISFIHIYKTRVGENFMHKKWGGF